MILILGWTWVDADWLHSYIANKGRALILDVRTPAEHAAGYIPGTDLLIPHYELKKRLKELKVDPERDTVIVYCRSGNRSTVAAKILEEAGFKNVLNLRGGIRSWVRKGYELRR